MEKKPEPQYSAKGQREGLQKKNKGPPSSPGVLTAQGPFLIELSRNADLGRALEGISRGQNTNACRGHPGN